MSILFQPMQLGDIHIANRIIMAPLTRSRAPNRLPNALMQEYYVQRASAGLIITEATAISPKAVGYADTPGIWNAEQIQAWKKITQAVHKAGGKIVLQLWHVGRISHPTFLDGELPVAPSAIKPSGHVSLLRPKTPYLTPRALALSEIAKIVEGYKQAAMNAKAAGFDGVELHAANGYLIDQFLQSQSNAREDHYGGSVENRARLLLEVTDALISVWGAGRVGVHLAPRGDSYDMGDDNPLETFSYAMKALDKRNIAFVFIREHQLEPGLLTQLRSVYKGKLIANERLQKNTAEQMLNDGHADAVAFGMLYIANPDLVERFAANAPLNEVVFETIYGDGAQGYTDYPKLVN